MGKKEFSLRENENVTMLNWTEDRALKNKKKKSSISLKR